MRKDLETAEEVLDRKLGFTLWIKGGDHYRVIIESETQSKSLIAPIVLCLLQPSLDSHSTSLSHIQTCLLKEIEQFKQL